MHFSVATILTTALAAASTASALAIHPAHIAARDEPVVSIQERDEPIVSIQEDDAAVLEKRGALIAIATAAGTEAAVQAASLAIKAVGNLIKDISNWDSARQAFTQEVTKKMMDSNTNPAYVAAACYNKDYNVQNWNNVDGKTSVKFKLGALKTDYDCMYLKAPNVFWTASDGGYQNLAYRYTKACTFDQSTQDLTCK